MNLVKRLLSTFVLWALGAACVFAESKSVQHPDNEEALQATAAVFQLFEAKCNDCHGSQLVKPKGKFGYVMDLKRVAENDDYVTAGDPSKSELFRLVNEDEMPGKDSKFDAATPGEKLALRRWIQMGAPLELPADLKARQAQLLSLKPGDAALSGPAKAEESFFGKLLSWLGRFHAASTHFPVGLLMIAVLSEAVAWWTKKDTWLSCTRFLIIFGALSAAGTVVLGWLNAWSGNSPVYQIHKWLGTATGVWAFLSCGCAVLFECREGTMERARLRVVLALGALAVAVTGFLGGALVYGLDHYKW